MAPDWEKLSGEWDGHEVGLIAEVDCTADGKPLCDANGVRGFPTLKYGDPTSLDDYQGGREYDALAKFATDNLKPICSPSNLDICDDDKKKQIEDLNASIEEEEKKLTAAEDDFKAEVEKLQKQYQELMEEKDAKLAAVKDSGLGLMKSVKAAKAKAGSDEL